ncbi:mannitol dehydrogenase family protein [Planktotalea sp.]|uniref:mannitol dehydrogenase family protein n=1 Tax=Planktotalea sp. TaxID=2029877 RepID=UPI0025DDA01F|nr:mannitol dehydrogenase family protein [Planktotalea sp.]
MHDKPRLNRSGAAPKIGIVHLGPGAFFRAFNACYTHEVMEKTGGDWGIVAVSLQSATARDQLEPQGGVFTSVTLEAEGWNPSQIGSIVRTFVAPEDPKSVIAAMADPNVKIVSMTITEKGYCVSPVTGELDLDHPDIVHDLLNPNNPRTAVGFCVAALAARRGVGIKPFTILPCDNLPSNGTLARATIIKFARQLDRELADWIAETTTFPSTMVDRITPATTQSDIDQLADLTGYHDPACVLHEGFRQWVIEDDFVDGHPAWDVGGAQFVASVEAHEMMKLRCLNGTHSTLAYLGYLAGYETIADVVGDPDFAALCEILWRDEIIPTLIPPDGENLAAYCASLSKRFENPAIQHRTWQIAMDGSQKLPQRLLGTIADNFDHGVQPSGLTLAVAGWMHYVGAIDENGDKIDVRDPLSDTLKAASESGTTSASKVTAFLELDEIFPKKLAHNALFVEHVTQAYETLAKRGAKGAVRALISQ